MEPLAERHSLLNASRSSIAGQYAFNMRQEKLSDSEKEFPFYVLFTFAAAIHPPMAKLPGDGSGNHPK
jgi:hypothetical protein